MRGILCDRVSLPRRPRPPRALWPKEGRVNCEEYQRSPTRPLISSSLTLYRTAGGLKGLSEEEKKPIRLKGASIFFVNKKHWRKRKLSEPGTLRKPGAILILDELSKAESYVLKF